MNETITCPYCGAENTFDTSDFTDEDQTHDYECDDCGKTYAITSSISWSYDAERLDCVNGIKPHRWVSHSYQFGGKPYCSVCFKIKEDLEGE